MHIPVRCFTCGTLIGNKWDEYKKRTDKGEEPNKVLDDLEVKKYCCRRMFLGQTEVNEEVKHYQR